MTTPVRILLVDDNPYFLDVARDYLLMQESFQVAGIATDGSGALEQAMELHPDVILLDLNLGGESAIKLIPVIKERLPETKIVVVTIQDGGSYRDVVLKQGADAFVHKSVMTRTLITSINSLMNRSKTNISPLTKKPENPFIHLIEKSKDLVYRYEITPTRGFTYVNPAALPLTGYTPEEHYADPDLGFKLVHPEDRALLEAARSGEISFDQPLILRWVRKDGTVLWTEQRNVPIYNENGELVALEGTASDITSQIQNEQALREREVQIHGIIDSAMDAILSIDEDQRIALFNPAAEKMFQLAAAEALGRPVEELIPVRFRPGHRQWVDGFAHDGETGRLRGHPGGSAYGMRRNGEEFPIEASISHMEFGGKYQYTVIVRDITARKQAEEALQESEDKFRYIFDYSLVGKSITTPSGEVNVNKAFCEMLGYAQEEMKHKNWRDITHPDEIDISEGISASLLSGEAESVRFVKRFIHKNGSVVWADVSSSLRRDRKGQPLYFITITNDITDRIRMEEAIRESERFVHSTLNALTAHIAVLDETGTIIAVNRAWLDFAQANGGDPARTGLGVNYLEVCEQVRGPEETHARQMAEGIRAVMRGEQEGFRIEYPCDSPDEQRWFKAHITRFKESGPTRIVIRHENITEQKSLVRDIKERVKELTCLFRIQQDLQDDVSVDEFCERALTHIIQGMQFPDLTAVQIDLNGSQYHSPLYTPDLPDGLEAEIKQKGKTIGRLSVHYTENKPFIFPEETNMLESVAQSMGKWMTQKQADTALRSSEENYRNLAETSDSAIAVLNREGTIVYANPASTRIWKDPLIGRTVFDLFPEKNASHYLSVMRHVIDEQAVDLNDLEIRIREQVMWFRVSMSPMKNSDGSVNTLLLNAWDLTDRKKAEETIREQMREITSYYDNAPIGLAVFDKDLRFIKINRQLADINGLSPAEHVGKTVEEIVPNLASQARKLTDEIIQTGKPAVNVEFVGETSADPGAQRIWREGWYPLKDEAGQVTGFEVIVEDITERKKAIEALRAAENRFRALVENSSDEISIIAPDGSLIYESPTASPTLGYLPGEFQGQNIFQLIHSDDMNRIQREFVQLIQSPGSHHRDQFRLLRRDGSWCWVEAVGTNLLAEPSVRGIVVNYHDISDRKQAEEQIRRQVERLTALREIDQAIASSFDLETNLDTILLKTVQLLEVDAATVLLLNPATERLEYASGLGFRSTVPENASISFDQSYAGACVRTRKGIHLPELSQQPDNKFLVGFLKDEDFVSYDCMPLIVKEQVVGVLEVFNRSRLERDEEWFDFLSTLAGQTAIAMENSQLFKMSQRELAERRQAEENLRILNARLEQRVAERTADLSRLNLELERAMRVKDEFLANMSHELRTPLNAIIGLSESLSEQIIGDLNEKQQKYLHTISENGHHLLELINDILDLAKIEAGKIVLSYENVNVEQVSQASLRMVRQLAQKKNQQVVFEMDERLDLIWADGRRLKQMLVNLLGNAIKFTPENGQIGLTIRGNRAANQITFTVWDTGIGIKEQDLDRLFRPFEQLDSDLSRESGGTGLGLALVAQMARLHGGSVRAESQFGAGSRFTITLPWESALLNDSNSRIKSTGKLHLVKSDAKNSKRTILLVEDTEEVVMVVRDYLEFAGYKVSVARNGVEGLEMAQKVRPDLILMDVQMPGLDGLDTTRRLRRKESFQHVPIIALTARAMLNDREMCLAAGIDEYLTKPVHLKSMVRLIQKFLLEGENVDKKTS